MKEKAIAAPSFWQELMHAGVYKRTQGKITRQVTFTALLVAIVLGAWRLRLTLEAGGAGLTLPDWVQYAVPLAVVVLGVWAAFRLVNFPRFADFLIAVEAEMNKVSWPSQGEMIRSSIVVIFVIFALAGLLFFYDLLWQVVFQLAGVVKS